MRLIRALVLLIAAAAVFDGLWFIKTEQSQILRLWAQFTEESLLVEEISDLDQDGSEGVVVQAPSSPTEPPSSELPPPPLSAEPKPKAMGEEEAFAADEAMEGFATEERGPAEAVVGEDSKIQPSSAEPEFRSYELRAPVMENMLLDEPQPGYVAYDPPSVMEQGETYQIRVRIGTEALRDELLSNLSGSGVPTIDPITTTPLMSVRLEGGDDFGVQSYSSEVQWLMANEPTQWLFDVTALQAGETKILRLFLSWQVVVDGNPTGRDFEPFVKEIEVTVNRPYQAKQFVLAYFELAFAIAGGFFGFLFRRLFDRRR